MAKEKTDNLRFGWFGWKPNCLQFLNTPNGFLLWMLLGNTFVSIATSGLGAVAISSIEVRFKLNSNQSGWTSSAYEIAALPMYLLIAVFGNRLHRPFASGLGIVLVSVGCLLYTLPHFTTDLYVPEGHEGHDDFLCVADDNSMTSVNRTCSEDVPVTSPLSQYFVVFVIARLCQGLGIVPMITLTVTFLDDCLPKEKFSFYLSLFLTSGLIGSSLGYGLGGYLLSLHTDFLSVGFDKVPITSDDPRWVGCWWIGFLLTGVVMLFIAVPFMGYPSDLPGAAEVRAKKVTEAHRATHNDVDDDVTLTCSSLVTSCRRLACNPVYIFITLFACTDMFILNAFGNFGPKYVESQYSVTAGFAGMIFGVMTIPGGVLGTVCGGWLIQRYRLTTAQILGTSILLTVLLVTTGFMFFIICEPVSFAGVTQPYSNESYTNLTSACNVDCACANVPFTPVCGADNVQYYSPCHAGCAEINQEKVYSNCSCIPGPVSSTRPEPCTVTSCTLMPLFVVLFFLALLFLTMAGAMTSTVTLRCVPRKDRSAALGLQGTVARLLGSVPAPMAFGAAFDWSCTLWQETCGQRGTCLSYNNTLMSVYIFVFSMGIKMVSVVFVAACWWLYKPPVLEESALVVDGRTGGGGEGDTPPSGVQGNLGWSQGYDNDGFSMTTKL